MIRMRIIFVIDDFLLAMMINYFGMLEETLL